MAGRFFRIKLKRWIDVGMVLLISVIVLFGLSLKFVWGLCKFYREHPEELPSTADGMASIVRWMVWQLRHGPDF